MHDHDHDFDHDRIGLVKVKRSTALSVILAGVLGSLVFTMVPQAGGAVLPPGGTFIDDNGNPFEGSIEAIAAEGITKGCNPPVNNRFCPNDNVTRGEMALFLVRALGYTDSGGGNLFTDDDGAFYEDAADKLGAAKVTLGCNPPTNDRFCGNENVTRGQMAAFLVRAMGYTDTGGGNMFSDDDGHPFENDIDKLAAAGVTKGCHPNLFCPNELVARGQMAAFLTRALGLTPIVPPPPTLSGIRISPGESIQAAVDSNPEGAKFILGAGTHSLSAPIRPKSGQRFIGEGSAVFTGNSATPVAFKGEAARNVEVRGLIIEYFASIYQGQAALHAGNGWMIAGNEVRYNAGGGIFHE